MAEATLVVIPPSQIAREVEISEGIISIGRALDNTIPVDGDTSISRYHAEIESRNDGFWVYDLGSSNGTTVNDEPVTSDRKLEDGDMISFGGETYIEFKLRKKQKPKEEKKEEEKPPAKSATSAAETSAAAAPSSSGVSILLIAAGVMGGLAILAIAGIALYMVFGSSCPGDVTIISPESGAVVSGPTKIQVNFQEGDEKCIDRVIYQIDGKDTIEVESRPFETTLDPGAIPGFADGNTHTLEIVVEDLKGNKRKQNQTVLLSYGTAPPPTSSPDPNSTPGGTNPNGGGNTSPPVQVKGDPKQMSEGLATKISGRSGHVFTPELMTMVRARMNEYTVAGGAGNRAQTFKRDINKAFRDRGVNVLVGYMLAMSRSKFNPNLKGNQGELGLWQISPAIVRGPNFLTASEPDTVLLDSKRGSEIAAAYINDLLTQFSNEGFMYAIACFGMSLEEVGKFKLQLEKTDPSRTLRIDFMQMVKAGIVTPEMQDRVVRFIAAGIIGENPQAFGLSDPPLSSL